MLRNNWDLKIKPVVPKLLRRIPKEDRERIAKAIDSIADDPFVGDIKKIEGLQDVWRRRVGSYRIFYKIRAVERLVVVFLIERRSLHTYS